MNEIIIRGLRENNLKNIDLEIPKNEIVVFTGVSGSGKSSIVFDTVARESQRQMNETYSTWVRGRLPKYEKPNVESIENLNPSVIVDQARLGGNARSTVGTISDTYSLLRLLFSRIAEPHVGPASSYSFNNPGGMCPTCSGLGKILDLDISSFIVEENTYDQGCFLLPAFRNGNYYWKVYRKPEYFRTDVAWKDLEEKEKNFLLYGSYEKDGPRLDKKVEGIYNQFKRLVLMKGEEEQTDATMKKIGRFVYERECPDCRGRRLNGKVLSSRINGYNIADLCEMEFTKLRKVLDEITDPRANNVVLALKTSLDRMMDIGLSYLSMNRETTTLSGGEAQRVKMVRHMGSSLTGMIYIFDEPSTGMHPRDVYRMTNFLKSLRDKGNSVLVVEHDKDVIKCADTVIDIGPGAGRHGGEVLFKGSYTELLKSGTKTGNALQHKISIKENPRRPKRFLPIRGANLHNLKNVDVDIPLGVLTVVTGVAGSGKSTLIRNVFASLYKEETVLIDQSAITATGRSTVCTYLGFFDEIRKVFSSHTSAPASLFTFNGKGGCPYCKGRGYIVTEMIFMESVTSKCEHCGGLRYSDEALEHRYKGKTIVDVLSMSVEEAVEFFFQEKKILEKLNNLMEVGLSYISLGQSLSTFSGGERQRVKLADNIRKKGNIYILDEPTTGLHPSDIEFVMGILESMVEKGNTVVVIEHNTDVMKKADYIIDVGPDGGSGGGEIMFTGTVADMIASSDSLTARYLRKDISGE